MDKRIEAARIQEEQYAFPYHHLPRREAGAYRQSATHRWGYEYLGYLDYVRTLLAKRSWGNLIDVGCGDGKFVYELSREYADKQLIGADISERAVSLARGIYPNGEYLVADITKKPFGKTFDAITLIETLEHIPLELMEHFLDGLTALMHQDSFLIITVPSTNVPTAKKHFQHFTADSLKQTLAPRLEVIEVSFLNRLSPVVSLIERLLSNRFFYLSEPHLSSALYALYVSKYLVGTEKNTKRLCAVCRLQR